MPRQVMPAVRAVSPVLSASKVSVAISKSLPAMLLGNANPTRPSPSGHPWPSSAARMRPLRPRLYRPWLAISLLTIVFVDIVRSNIAVGRIILGLVRDRTIRSGLLEIPLDLRDPHGLAVLATIITSTPGTVWVDHEADRAMLTVHILDMRDPQTWIRVIKDRYERPLIRIFQP